MQKAHHEYKLTLTKRIRIKISRHEHNLQPKRMKMKTVDDPEQTFAFPFSVQWVPYETDTNHRVTKLTLCSVRDLLGTLCAALRADYTDLCAKFYFFFK